MIPKNFFINWFKNNGRHFPWRDAETTPFQLLVTEVLLRQTRAIQVEKIWRDFVGTYPTPELLNAADESELTERLKVLGFGRQRADALKKLSAYLVDVHAGKVPQTLAQLLAIPHIGNYSARAILSLAFLLRFEIVDTNVLRLFSRYFGIQLKPDIRRSPEAWQIAADLLPKGRSRIKEHNYGVLDFTATVCKPRGPLCSVCPLRRSCHFAATALDK